MAADSRRGPADSEQASRRQFFRVFGRQTVAGAGNVLAGVEALRRSGQDALDDLIGNGQSTSPVAGTLTPPDELGLAAFKSPYRYTGSALEILDQWGLPARADTVTCAAPSEVASAFRRGLLAGGPVLGEVAAYTLAMAAATAGGADDARRAALAAADILRGARPTNRAISVAIDRLLERAETTEADLPIALLDEADQLASAAMTAHGRLGAVGGDALSELAQQAAAHNRPLGVLMCGDHGPLTGGQIGPGVAIVQSLTASGHAVHVWVTEDAPLYEGRRAAWALSHLAIKHTLLPDTALYWLFANRRIDVLLLRAETMAANGDLVAPLGSLAAADAARATGVRVAAVVPTSQLDGTRADVSGLPGELRLPAPNGAPGPRIDPAADVVGHALLDLVITEEGVLLPPFGG
jgi:methylthioribose-1-phosphate isomerase